MSKGMLLHITCKMFSRKAYSGTELMDEIEERTGWRPSSGSIYPLLSSLTNEGVIRQIECSDQSIKRFTITPAGEKEIKKLEEHIQFIRDNYDNLRRIYLVMVEEMQEEVYDAYSDLYRMILMVNRASNADFATLYSVTEILNNASNEIRKFMSSPQ